MFLVFLLFDTSEYITNIDAIIVRVPLKGVYKILPHYLSLIQLILRYIIENQILQVFNVLFI